MAADRIRWFKLSITPPVIAAMRAHQDRVKGTAQAIVLDRELARLKQQLESRPEQWGEIAYRKGTGILRHSICAAGCTLFHVRFAVYPASRTVMLYIYHQR